MYIIIHQTLILLDIIENRGVNYSIVKDKNKVKFLFNVSLSGSIDVYSLDGTKVVSKKFSGKEVSLSLKKGLYIISINSNLLTKKERLAMY
ncbi:MAG: T9SS type A sorting domain-containing protein [candidate division WOR-3 bacterium]|nr:T9SS type A sorting domain-containing protein [candidate division WOR-3 bacterium]